MRQSIQYRYKPYQGTFIRQGIQTPMGDLQSELAKVSTILTEAEANAIQAKKTQDMYQMLAMTGTIVLGLTGVFVIYKFAQSIQKNKKKKAA